MLRRRLPSSGRGRLVVGLLLLTVVALAGLLAPWVAPYDPNTSGDDVLAGVSADHWFGTSQA